MQDDVIHPEKLNQFHCEQCGAVCDAEVGVDREDEYGDVWCLCPDCGGEYDRVIVAKEGSKWVLKKANYHEIDRYDTRTEARQVGEELAFRVDIQRD